MTRRTLLAGLGLPSLQRRYIRLEALYAPRVPQIVTIGPLRRTASMPERGQLLELRSWEGCPQLDGLLRRYGLAPIFSVRTMSGRIDLIPLKDLSTRAAAWSALVADEEWIGGPITGVELYRAL